MNLHNFISAAIKNNGASYSISTGQLNPTLGCLVSLNANGQKSETLTKKELISFIEKNACLLDTPGHYLGLWKNNDVWYYDVSVLVYSRLFASRLGIREMQLSVWDCKRKECIYLPSLQDIHDNFKKAIRDGLQIVKIYGISVEIPTPQRTGTTYQKEAYIHDSAIKLTDNFYKVLRAVVSGDESAHLTIVSIYKNHIYA